MKLHNEKKGLRFIWETPPPQVSTRTICARDNGYNRLRRKVERGGEKWCMKVHLWSQSRAICCYITITLSLLDEANWTHSRGFIWMWDVSCGCQTTWTMTPFTDIWLWLHSSLICFLSICSSRTAARPCYKLPRDRRGGTAKLLRVFSLCRECCFFVFFLYLCLCSYIMGDIKMNCSLSLLKIFRHAYLD